MHLTLTILFAGWLFVCRLVYAVGVGRDVSMPELRQISDGVGDENISLVDDFASLVALIQTIVDSLERVRNVVLLYLLGI